MEFQLVLVRHGYSLGNEKSLFSGWSDVPLTERGRRELRELRQVIRYPRTGRYFSSDLSRCRETFQELYGRTSYWTACARSSARSVLAHWKTVLVHRRTLCIFSGLGWQGTPSLM